MRLLEWSHYFVVTELQGGFRQNPARAIQAKRRHLPNTNGSFFSQFEPQRCSAADGFCFDTLKSPPGRELGEEHQVART